ncbi:MAG: hypothetical protein CEE40_08395 [Chloroflexi bacterium B3_Chlor]|nr:MAG: hypothetical protein CEE40_08395 [Chloroflexi bacterium B3_Chlor]
MPSLCGVGSPLIPLPRGEGRGEGEREPQAALAGRKRATVLETVAPALRMNLPKVLNLREV